MLIRLTKKLVGAAFNYRPVTILKSAPKVFPLILLCSRMSYQFCTGGSSGNKNDNINSNINKDKNNNNNSNSYDNTASNPAYAKIKQAFTEKGHKSK